VVAANGAPIKEATQPDGTLRHNDISHARLQRGDNHRSLADVVGVNHDLSGQRLDWNLSVNLQRYRHDHDVASLCRLGGRYQPGTNRPSFDHFGCAHENLLRNLNAQRLGCFQVYDHIKYCRLFIRQL